MEDNSAKQVRPSLNHKNTKTNDKPLEASATLNLIKNKFLGGVATYAGAGFAFGIFTSAAGAYKWIVDHVYSLLISGRGGS
jgi:hypothetical protein